jgi:hypothetical protein
MKDDLSAGKKTAQAIIRLKAASQLFVNRGLKVKGKG